MTPGTLALHERTGELLKEFFGYRCRLDEIAKADGRRFKSALANNELATTRKLAAATVDQHVRIARKIFANAIDDELVPGNPFDKLAGSAPVPKAWHEVTDDEFSRLMASAKPDWKLLLGLARWAGLRRGEALAIRWENMDWERHRLIVIANEEWKPKDRDCRTIPIVPELYQLLKDAYGKANSRRGKVIEDSINPKNIHRDVQVLFRAAKVERWKKPMHTLRKTCLTRWAREFAMHVVKEWAGHADERTTMQFYLQVSESEYDKAAGLMGE